MRAISIACLAVASCYIRTEVNDCVLETCNGIDDDCDDLVDEGYALGEPCDGPDSDACEDGVTVCDPSGTATMCEDSGEEHADLCNGVADEDCDPTSPDGTGEPGFGAPCDGPDADSCPDGSTVCVDAQLVCNDATPDNVEVCNSIDDDCNGTVDDGFDLAGDVANCGACGNVCTNAHGTTACQGGACVYSCDPGAQDCNGDPDDGCEVLRDAGATCADAIDLGAVEGDGITEFVERAGTDAAIYQVYVTEESSSETDPTALVELESPPGVNFDLYVACGACGGAWMDSSTQPDGVVDTVDFRTGDTYNVDDSRLLVIEVRYAGGDACGAYTLRVTGRPPIPAPIETCP